MSCELKTFACINDPDAVRRSLRLENVDTWLTSALCAAAPTFSGSSINTSYRPVSGLLCFAHAQHFTILHGRWDTETQCLRYNIEHSQCVVPLFDEASRNVSITAVACVPIASFGDHDDWTCVAVGLSNGRVRFYNDGGEALATYAWNADEPVQHIKVCAADRQRSASTASASADELHIVHTTCVCVIPGAALVQMLRNRNCEPDRLRGESLLNNEPIGYRRWAFGGSAASVNDALVVGAQRSNAFDHLLNASRDGGFYAQYKSAPQQNSLIVGIGGQPFVGFHWAKERFVPPILNVFASVVAQQIKSALPSWLVGGGSATASADVQQQTSVEAPPLEPLHLRFGLCDQSRIGLQAWLAPDRLHAAVADQLGRVMLIDCYRGIAVRVWKGYRDAQCAFVQSNEKHPPTTKADADQHQRRRRAMFLVIYAPKRASLECWLLQRGPRVAAFSVRKGGRLLGAPLASAVPMGRISSTGGAVNATNAAKRAVSSAVAVCWFVDTMGEIRELHIPFHTALSDEYARTSKDLHLLRRIRMCIRQSDDAMADDTRTVAEVGACCAALQTDEVRQKCIDMLVRDTKVRPQLLRTALQMILNATDDNNGMDDNVLLNEEDRNVFGDELKDNLRLMSGNYLRLVDFYLYMERISSQPEAKTAPQNARFVLSQTELDNIEQFLTLKLIENDAQAISRTASGSQARVTFNVGIKSSWFADYLAVFESTKFGPRLRRSGSVAVDDKLTEVGEQMFHSYIDGGDQLDVSAFVDEAGRARLSSEDLMRLLLAYWLSRGFVYIHSEVLLAHLQSFGGLVWAICMLPDGPLATAYDYNTINEWWQCVREQLLQSNRPMQCWLAAIVCRALAEGMRRETSCGGTSSDACGDEAEEVTDEVWEQVPQEAAEWTLLVDKLDDVAVLALALSSTERLRQRCDDAEDIDDAKAAVQRRSDTALARCGAELAGISLASIVRGGTGIVTELMAQWCITLSIEPHEILDSQYKDGETDGTDVPRHVRLFRDYWQFVRGRFPFSLQSARVLAHMAWLYMSDWTRHMDDMRSLDAALRCVRTIPDKKDDNRIGHGLCSMIWNAHLKIPIQAASRLLNQYGRLPSEVHCMQEVGLSAMMLGTLLNHTLDFWDEFSKMAGRVRETIDEQADDNGKLKMIVSANLRHEELLQDGPVALAQLAYDQSPGAPTLLRLHSELLQMMFMMAVLNLHWPKPVQSNFDSMAVLTFFSELNRAPAAALSQPDAVLQRRRAEFLQHVIARTIDTIRPNVDGTLYVDEHETWMGRVQRLCDEWQLDADALKRRQIVELYESGHDAYAEPLIDGVLNVAALCEILLRIAGRRLSVLICNRPRLYAEVASVGSMLVDFLDVLNSSRDTFKRPHREFTLVQLNSLAVQAFTGLADTNGREKRIAAQLFDACQRLLEMEEVATE